MKIVFAGTTPFSAFHLDLLIKSKNEVAAVLTQPDRKSGRGKKLKISPVKAFAE
jgi:methionyl-tRNA formyltransferase